MMKQATINITQDLQSISSGLLGAEAFGPYAEVDIHEERRLMVERRILRIEEALRRAGIEVEELELPNDPR